VLKDTQRKHEATTPDKGLSLWGQVLFYCMLIFVVPVIGILSIESIGRAIISDSASLVRAMGFGSTTRSSAPSTPQMDTIQTPKPTLAFATKRTLSNRSRRTHC
jgi:hypothetical protein